MTATDVTGWRMDGTAPAPVRDGPASEGVRATSPAMRALLTLATVLVVAAGLSLFVLTEHTDRFFAWTITSPLTAAFFGAGYLGAACLDGICSRKRVWAEARLPLPAVLVFTTITLGVTLVHLEKFHLDSFFGWAWLVAYVALPLAGVAAFLDQRRAPGRDIPPADRLPRWLHATVRVAAAGMALLGAAMLASPVEAMRLWPWALTPLTARAVAAWLIILAVVAVQLSQEDDWRRLRPLFASYAAMGVLQLVALARYPDEVRWGSPSAWVYVTAIAGMTALGAYGSWRAGKVRQG
jgi:multisubunit Na+/H+ antiporter MnhC subunit